MLNSSSVIAQKSIKVENKPFSYDKLLSNIKQHKYDTTADYCLIFQIDSYIEQHNGNNASKFEILTDLNIKSGYSKLNIGDDYYIGVKELPVDAFERENGIFYASMRRIKGESNPLLHIYPKVLNKKEKIVRFSARVFNLDTSTVSFVFDNKKLEYQRQSKDYYLFANSLVNANLGIKLDFDNTFIASIKKYYQHYKNDSLKIVDIHRMIRDNINYIEDTKESDNSKAPLLTMLDRAGDCEDSSLLICALGTILTKKYFFYVETNDHAVAAFSDSPKGEIEKLIFCDATGRNLKLGYKTIENNEIISITPYK